MGIFSQIQSAVNSILPTLYNDEDLVTEITWKRFSSSIFDESQGMNVETYDEFTIDAIRVEKHIGGINSKTHPPGPWSMSVGDIGYLFQAPDLPDGISIRDQIVDGDITYGVKKITPVFGLITKVEVKGYA